MEITTHPLNLKQLKELIVFIHFFFKDLERLELMYGWECNTENQYNYFSISTQEFNFFLENSIKEKIFNLGASDLYIRDKENNFEFLLCHESDIHLKSSNKLILEKMQKKMKKMKVDFTIVEKGKL